jgi:hypothetical protein
MFAEWLSHPMMLPVTIPLVAGLLCLLVPKKGESLRSLPGAGLAGFRTG